MTSAAVPTPTANSRILAEILTTGEPLLRAQAQRHAQLPSDAEEALQSAYLLFLERYREPYEPLPWLLTTVKREAWRIAKRSSRRREAPIAAVPRNDGLGAVDLTDAFPDLAPKPPERAERDDLCRRRRRLLARLKPDQRTALILFALGLSYAEIAELRGWTMTKVNRCIAEGRAALRRTPISA